jgi:hypothetical protein
VAPSQTGFSTTPLRGTGALAINTGGNREEAVGFLVNGVTTNNLTFGSLMFQPPIASIQEFKVDNSTFSPEYGHVSGAIVSIATRSGSDRFGGEAFEFFRNDAMDARNFFEFTSSEPHPFNRNQFGGSVGGPVVRGKTFFFASYETLRQEQGLDMNSLVLSEDQLIWSIEPSWRGTTIPGFGLRARNRRGVLTINHTHLFGPALVNEARFGRSSLASTNRSGAELNPAGFGIRNGIDHPIGLPQMLVAGGLNFGGPSAYPNGRDDGSYVFTDTVRYARGWHTVKAGGEYRHFINENVSGGSRRSGLGRNHSASEAPAPRLPSSYQGGRRSTTTTVSVVVARVACNARNGSRKWSSTQPTTVTSNVPRSSGKP